MIFMFTLLSGGLCNHFYSHYLSNFKQLIQIGGKPACTHRTETKPAKLQCDWSNGRGIHA